ncbi:MAG: methyl-accepting chemotaxis protein [Xenococcaceae cyanobacterium MO_188.B29]|nr:methyl-accepting chemotaxis protein [Xenococcaceae cyanobacterium MO_188.B29]
MSNQPTTGNEDCVGKILEANSLEKSGEIEQAIAIYQEIIALDGDGNYGAVAQQALANLQSSSGRTATKAAIQTAQENASWWSKLSLRWKVTGLAIALSTIPVVALGGTAYYIISQTIESQIAGLEEARVSELSDKISLFLYERYGDMQIISKAGILIDSNIRNATTREQKDAILAGYLQSYPFFNSIAAFNLNGDVLAHSEGGNSNHQDSIYFKAVLESKKTYIGEPRISKKSGFFAVYIATPIIDKDTKEMIGVVRARMPVEKIETLLANYGKDRVDYLLIDSNNQTFLSSKEEWEGKKLDVNLSKVLEIKTNESTGTVIGQDLLSKKEQLISFSSITSKGDTLKINWSAIIAEDKDAAFAVEQQLLLTLEIGILVTVLSVSALATFLSYRGTLPLIKSTDTVQKLGQGELDVRMDVIGADELADLGTNINLMAEQIQDLIRIQEAETKKQKQEKERLQQGVVNLLLDVEGAQKGDLTVKAKMTEGAVGSIADAFNSIMSRLRALLQQVQTVSNQVGELSLAGENSVRQLSEAALNQAEEINSALSSIAEINESVQNVAGYAQEAAQIASQGLTQAKEGDAAMDSTVDSIEKIRTTVASTSKQVKQLSESSQEIAQIVEIISGISEKTNLLAFNASVEAARAGEHGDGFRIVAEEVRRLADRITDSTKDIQQLVSAIQQDTTAVLQGMETSTTEVVTGSELVRKTKQNLQNLANTSEKIDRYLQSISTSTIDQTNTARQVNEKISGIATIAKENSTEAQNVVKSLRTLVEEAETLQESVSQFKLQA